MKFMKKTILCIIAVSASILSSNAQGYLFPGSNPAQTPGVKHETTDTQKPAAEVSKPVEQPVAEVPVAETVKETPEVQQASANQEPQNKSPRLSFTKGNGAPIDTLDIGDDLIKVVLLDNGTWFYIRDIEKMSGDSLFTDHWIEDSVNPYSGVALSSLPLRHTIVLADSLSNWCCPNQTKVFSKFGYRHRRRHQGVDLPYPMGTPVKAAFDGRVRASTYSGGYGKLIIIRHTNGLETYYGHLSERKVNVGDWVRAGDIIGLGGSTGRSSGPHLHFETRYKGFAFDPEWIADFEKGTLRSNVFVLKRTYLDPSSHYVPETIDEEEDVYTEEEKIRAEEQRRIEEQKRIAAEKAAMRYHTVKSGETLSHIAAKYGKSLKTIKALNPKINPDKLRIGQKIRVN